MDLALNSRKFPQPSGLEKVTFPLKNFMINSLIMKLLSNKKILAPSPLSLPKMFNFLDANEGVTQTEEASSEEITTTEINLVSRGRSLFPIRLLQTFLPQNQYVSFVKNKDTRLKLVDLTDQLKRIQLQIML